MVAIGPLALAGSNFNLPNKYGIISPVITEDIMAENKAIDKTKDNVGSWYKKNIIHHKIKLEIMAIKNMT